MFISFLHLSTKTNIFIFKSDTKYPLSSSVIHCLRRTINIHTWSRSNAPSQTEHNLYLYCFNRLGHTTSGSNILKNSYHKRQIPVHKVIVDFLHKVFIILGDKLLFTKKWTRAPEYSTRPSHRVVVLGENRRRKVDKLGALSYL